MIIAGTNPETYIETASVTDLVKVGSRYYLLAEGTKTGPALSYIGTPVVAGASTWTPIGVEKTVTGYQVAWKDSSTGQFTVWNTDNSGNFASVALGVVPGTNTALQLLETTFQQDLNGNGIIGLPTTVIEAFGATSLFSAGNSYVFASVGTTSGPTLSYTGSPVVAGASTWAPIGVEKTVTGYQVAWKDSSTGQFTVWNTDNSGNFASVALGVVPGTNSALQLLETTFQQDLNGNGIIGLPTTVIEAFGATSLLSAGNSYAFAPVGTTSGPTLSYVGTPVVAGASTWTPIGVEKTVTGYQVAWKDSSTGQFTVWNTDNSGNFASVALGVVPGTNTALQSLEPTFQQDLNGNGIIGLPTTVIEAFGATSLLSAGNSYVFAPVGTTSGPTLSYTGSPVVAGAGTWAPIGVEKSATGYLVAWKDSSTGQFTVWNTDNSGNFVSVALGVVAGTNTTLQSLETTFQQDLNGNGTIGLTTTVVEAFGATRLLQADVYLFTPLASASGPTLSYIGSAVLPGSSSWAPISVEAASGGYLVAWKDAVSGQFTVWNTDNSGNFVSVALGVVAGSTTELKSYEAIFHHDLNGDGVVGLF